MMGVPLSQLSFREPEVGLWFCKREMYFNRDSGATYTCKVGESVVVARQMTKAGKHSWLLVFNDGSTGYVDWQFEVHGRWSKRFECGQ